jgi:O-antigen/teichoic acid export membrane protein
MSAPTTSRSGDVGLVVGVIAGTLLAYVFQLVGGRLLGPEDFAPISVLWTLMFLTGTVGLTPIEQFVARESTAGRRVLTRHSWIIAVVIGVTASIAAAFTTLTRDRLFLGSDVFIVMSVALVIATAPLFLSRGLAVGHHRFGMYGAMLGLEGLGRLVVGGIGLAVVGGPVGLAWGVALGPAFGLLVPTWRFERRAAGPRSRTDASFLAPYIGASAASQLLLAGAPLAVAALGASPSAISIVFVTFTLFRAPVTIVYLLQGRLLNVLVRLDMAGSHATLTRIRRQLVIGGSALVACAGMVGWLFGPWVVSVLYGAEFRPDPLVAALAATGVSAGAVAQLLGQLLVARGRTASLARRWTVGLVVAIVVLIVRPAGPELTVALAFALGELAAVLAMAAPSRRRG